MRVEIVKTDVDAAPVHVDGQLVNMEIGERGELTVYGHDAADGTITNVLVVAPGEWAHGRWVNPPDPEYVKTYRDFAANQRHGRTGREGFL